MTLDNLPMTLPVPLREGWTAQIIIPRDITREEVERIYRVLCAIPDSPSEDKT